MEELLELISCQKSIAIESPYSDDPFVLTQNSDGSILVENGSRLGELQGDALEIVLDTCFPAFEELEVSFYSATGVEDTLAAPSKPAPFTSDSGNETTSSKPSKSKSSRSEVAAEKI